ncbi:MAG: OB-fold domain-containing protein [Kordiimonadaceae bacterium]|nr:OB-fold domain-containing protein [Kordiimonadaceae bacterium]
MASVPYGPDMGHFWDGIAEGQFRYRKCNSCHTALPSGSWVCPECWSKDLNWEVASGSGVVWSYVVYHRPFSPKETVPYNVVLVDLDEGIRIVATVDCPDEDLYVGMPVESKFCEETSGKKLKFYPLEK